MIKKILAYLSPDSTVITEPKRTKVRRAVTPTLQPTAVLSLRLKPQEKQLLAQLSASRKLLISTYVAQLIRSHLRAVHAQNNGILR